MSASPSALAPGKLAGLRVLLVEDDHDSRELLAELMTVMGVDVREARDGAEALEEFDRERPDVIVSDLYMPRLDGLGMIRAVRAREPDHGGLTPAIAISAGTDSEQQTLLGGFHVHFKKPADPMEVLRALASFAEAKREHGDEHANAAWTVAPRRPGEVLVTLRGHVHAAAMRAMVHALLVHLDAGPAAIVVDLRALAAFDAAAPSVAERAVWHRRDRIERVTIVGGTRMARLVSRAACAVIGAPCDVVDEMPP